MTTKDDPTDPVHRPSHYILPSGVECAEVVDALRDRWAQTGCDPHRLAAAFEYLWRAGAKEGAERRDVEKAHNMLTRALYGTWYKP